MGKNLQRSQILCLWTAGLPPPVPALHPQGRGKSLERQAFLQQMAAVCANQSINQSINQSMHMLGLQDSSEESTDNKLERKDVWEQMDAMCISVASLFIGCVGGLG